MLSSSSTFGAINEQEHGNSEGNCGWRGPMLRVRDWTRVILLKIAIKKHIQLC